jgi:hypothetical protein
MKNGSFIRQYAGESLVKAAERIVCVDAPPVMLTFLEPVNERKTAVQSFYHEAEQQAWAEEVTSEEYTSVSEEDTDSEGSEDADIIFNQHKVYLSAPQPVNKTVHQAYPAERTEPALGKLENKFLMGFIHQRRKNFERGKCET